MRKYYFTLVAFALGTIAAVAQGTGQNPASGAPSASHLQAFIVRRGALIIVDTFPAGEMTVVRNDPSYPITEYKLRLEAVVGYEPGKEDQRVKGVKIISITLFSRHIDSSGNQENHTNAPQDKGRPSPGGLSVPDTNNDTGLVESASELPLGFIDLDEIDSYAAAAGYIAKLHDKWQGARRDSKVTFQASSEVKLEFSQDGITTAGFIDSDDPHGGIVPLNPEEFVALRDLLNKGIAVLKEH